MKRLLTSAVLFLCCMATTFAQFSGSGSGTESDPYLLFNETQLAQVSNFLNQEGVVFKLMKDLDLTDWIAENNPTQGWIPIGVVSSPFKGKFYGNYHTIKGLMINRGSTNHVGFFGYVSDATIENLTIEGSSIVGASNVGGFVGYVIRATFTNCHIKLTEVKGSSHVGGFAGSSKCSTYNTFSTSALVTASEKTGGFIGYLDDGVLADGIVSGKVVGNDNYTGGLLGHATVATLTNIIVNSNVSGQDCTGGYMGYCANSNLSKCKYEGVLTGKRYVGGICGSIEVAATSFIDCHTKGTISALGDYSGGIVGASKGACIETMESCSHFGTIDGQSFLGGLVGAIIGEEENKPVLNTYQLKYDGEVSSTFTEKICNGTDTIKSINNCTVISDIKGINFVGGLIGADNSSFGYSVKSISREMWSYGLKEVYINGNLTYSRKGDRNALNGTWKGVTLSYSYNDYYRNFVSLSLKNSSYSGSVKGGNNVGGIVGLKSGGEIINNYTHGRIQGRYNVGGIVGQVDGNIIDNSHEVIKIKSNVSIIEVLSASESNVGRIIGRTYLYSDIGALGSTEGNRSISQTRVILSGVVQEVDDDLQNGTSIGPSALKLKANYVSWGWDFDNNWKILETESFPYKKYQAAPPVIESNLVSQAMGVSGKSLNGGTVYLYYKDHDAVSTVCNGNNWTFATEPLQSGAQVQIYADVEGMTPSYFATTSVSYPGKGTEADPYRVYTAEDLQGASNRGYYKLMNDIDLTQWINENSPTEGWPAIGRNSGEVTYIDGDGHKVTGLWTDTEEGFNGLFSNFSAGQIKNLTVEVAEGKKVKGGDYTGVLIGRNANGSIINCTVKGDVEGTLHTGGIAGYVENSTVQNVSYEGSVTSAADNAYVGGLIGQTKNCELKVCEAKATISTSGKNGKVGGLIGESIGGTISHSNAHPTLVATGENTYAGGQVGYSESPISNCSSGGEASATGESSYAGGLVGYAKAAIENSYSTAKTTGNLFSAGLVAYTFSKIDKCYAKGDVYGVYYGGGVVGELDGAEAKLTNSIACNNILSLSAQTSWGSRVIGGYKNGAADPDESNYALRTMQVSLNGVAQKKTDDIVEGKAMTQEVLMQKTTYQELGWDFEKTWDITEGEGYPTLREVSSTGEDDNPDPGDEPTPVLTDDDQLVVPQVTAHTGKTTTMFINLENKTTDLTAYQFDLTLPAGITLATNDKGKYLISKADRYDDDNQILTVSAIEGSYNTYRIMCYSMSSSPITGTSGAILNVQIMVDANVVAGSFDGNIGNIILTRTEGGQLKLANTSFTITVSDITKGDANGDNSVNVSDIVEIVNYIMGKPSAKFVKAAADLSGDGDVNVTDIVLVVNIIMAAGSNSSRSEIDMAITTANDRLTLTDGRSLRLENEGDYVAAQFDVRVSDGQTIDDISLNSLRSSRHLLTYAKTGDNLYKVVVYSLDNSTFDGHEGELLSIRVSGIGSVEIDNIVFVTTGNAEKHFAPLGGTATGLKAIDNLQFTIDNCYDLQGRRVTNVSKKGVYIVNGKKHVVR